MRMTRREVLDLYFMDARCKLIEIAAFLDRVDRGRGEGEGVEDFRLKAFRSALEHLGSSEPTRAERVLLAFSDPTDEPVERAPGKGACGAYQPGSQGA